MHRPSMKGLFSMTASPQNLRIDIVSDVMCPWCIIGYRQLAKALDNLGDSVQAETHWHPFELNPDMPSEGEDAGDHIRRKYGVSTAQSSANRQRMADLGESLGFAFDFSPGARMWNSFAAHILLHWAGEAHGWQAQTDLKLALFAAHFQARRMISDHAVLLDIAAGQGLDRDQAAAALADPDRAARVRAEQAYWIDQNITGVPAMIFDGRFMVPGAQDADTFRDVIEKVLAKRSAGAAA